LDAPQLVDDFYLNVLDWSSTNRVAIGLGRTLYLWSASGDVVNFMENEVDGNNVTAVKWSEGGDHIAIGCADNTIQLWDVTAQKCVRTMDGHLARVTAMDWNKHVLTSGSRDALILHHDVRSSESYTSVLRAHTEEICGLRWSPDGSQLASGGNDNMCYIWDKNGTSPRYSTLTFSL
jgi:WD40 repeat protein